MEKQVDLSSLFLTKSQATDFIQRLSRVLEKVYTTNFSLDATLGEVLGITLKERILKIMREQQIELTNPSEIQNFLKKLQESISALPTVTLTVPFEPTEDSLRAFSEWFLLTLKKQFLITIEVDKSLLAGARVTYKGKFKEYSFREKFTAVMDQYLKEKAGQPLTAAPTAQTLSTTTQLNPTPVKQQVP